MARDSVWMVVFLMVILKIPIVYLCTVVYYAIKAEPKPEAPEGVAVRVGPEDGDGPGRRRRRPIVPRPHGSPSRRYPRVPQPSVARAQHEEER
jgi:hypothetical protein